MNLSSDRRQYSPDTSRMMMRSRNDNESANDNNPRYSKRKDDDRPAPPPYVGQAIPRVKPIKTFQKVSGNNSVGERSRPTSRRFDTFGENALETIYDQFKFLDESEEPSSSQTPTSVNSTRPIMIKTSKKERGINDRRPGLVLYCLLPTIELISAIAILVMSFVFNRNDNDKIIDDRQNEAVMANQAVHNLQFQNALSTIIPASFQIISSLFGYWPIFPSNIRRPSQILHIFFNSILICLWFNAIYDLLYKISMEHIIQPGQNDEKYVIDLIIGCIIYFVTIILPSITLAVASFNLITCNISRNSRKSMISISLSLGTLLFSLATTVIAVFTAQANLNGVRELSDNSTMYAYGLKESIIFVFVVIISIFSLIVSTQNSKNLMLGGVIGQGICIMAITSELFTSERISAIVSELKGFNNSSSIEIGIVLLNGCAVASTILLVIQSIIFIFSISTSASLGSTHSLLDNNRNPPSNIERTAF